MNTRQEWLLYELKYCESCGELLVRSTGSTQTYCAPCEAVVMELALPARIEPGVRTPRLPGTRIKKLHGSTQSAGLRRGKCA